MSSDSVELVPAPAPVPAPAASLLPAWIALGQVALVSGAPTQIGVMALLWAAHALPTTGQLSLGFVAALILIDTALIVALVSAFVASTGERLTTLIAGTRTFWREAILGLLLLVPSYGLVAGLGLLLKLWPWLHNVEESPFQPLLAHPVDAFLLGLLTIVGGGFREELQRAFALTRFRQVLGGVRLGIVLFSVNFGLLHLPQGRDVAILTGALGAFWGAVYAWRGSLVAPAITHAAFDVLNVAAFSLATR